MRLFQHVRNRERDGSESRGLNQRTRGVSIRAAAWGAWCLAAASAAAQDAPPRNVVSLNGVWRIRFDPSREGETASWADPSQPARAWRRVRVPHVWNALPGRRTYRGAAWYRRKFCLPPAFRGKRLRLRFQRVAGRARVWLNGELLGERAAGFTPFSLDAAPALVGERNLLVVECDNEGAGLSSSAWPWGGLMGDVLIEAAAWPAVDRIALRVDLAGRDTALVDASARVTAAPDATFSGEIRFYLAPPSESGPPEWRLAARRPLQLSAGAQAVAKASFAIERVELWSFDSPRLYVLRVVAADARGRAIDAAQTAFGARAVRVSGPRLLLNGRWVRLAGFDRFADHSQAGPLEPRSVADADAARVRALNGVALRARAAPPHPNLVDACDRRGLLLTACLPLWRPTPDELADQETQRRLRAELEDMIRAYRNHPSIWSWSLGEGLPCDDASVAELVSSLAKLARRLDPTRPVTFTPSSKGLESPALQDVDYVSVNGFLAADAKRSALSALLDAAHAAWPDKMLVVNGWGCAANGSAASLTAVSRAVERGMQDLARRPYVAAALWGALRARRPEADAREIPAGAFDRDGRPTALADALRRAFAPLSAPGLAYRSDAFAAGRKLRVLVGWEAASPTARRLPCYRLASFLQRWSAGPAGAAAAARGEAPLPPFSPDYFAGRPRAFLWTSWAWTPGPGEQVVTVEADRPAGEPCVRRAARIRCLPAQGRSAWKRPLVLLDLSAYANNDGVSLPDDPQAGGFDVPEGGAGASYPGEDLPPACAVLVSDGPEGPAAWLFPDKTAARDNVSCRGQTVFVPPGRYRRVFVWGSADNGDFERDAEFLYRDGPAERRALRMSDWCGPSRFGETVALRCSRRRGWGGETEKKACFIRRQTLSADPRRVLAALRLPDEMHMHVFAITLETE